MQAVSRPVETNLQLGRQSWFMYDPGQSHNYIKRNGNNNCDGEIDRLIDGTIKMKDRNRERKTKKVRTKDRKKDRTKERG